MITIEFKGVSGDRIWGNVKNHLALLDAVPDLGSENAEESKAAEISLITFMVVSAWGYSRVSDTVYGSRKARFLYVNEINKDIYCLQKAKTNVEVVIESQDGIVTLSLGRAVGFTAVFPLTKQGFVRYFLNNKSMHELSVGDIVEYPYVKNSVEFVLVAGAVDFRALAPYLGGKLKFPRRAHGLLAQAGRQIGNFIPEVKLWQENGMVFAGTLSRCPLPTIICPLSGIGMGADLLDTAGFRPIGVDKSGNSVWIIDMCEINGKKIDDPHTVKLFKANRFIGSCLGIV